MSIECDSVGLAMIGCGGISEAHLRGIANAPQARLVAAMDVIAERAEQAAAKYKAEAYSSLDAVWADDGVEAVVLALPHDLHLPVTLQAARSGKHVLVEKPMALDLDEAQQMVAAAEGAGISLMVGQSTRFQPEVWAAKQLIAGGRIGQVKQCIYQRAFFLERLSTTWRLAEERCGGMYLPLFASHDVDVIWWLMDARPARVHAVLRSFTELVESESDGAVLIEFEDGRIASLAFSMNSHIGRRSALFIGTGGTLLIDQGELRLGDEVIEVDGSVDAFTRQVTEFVSALREGREPAPSGRDALATMAVLDAAKQSAQTGGSAPIPGSVLGGKE